MIITIEKEKELNNKNIHHNKENLLIKEKYLISDSNKYLSVNGKLFKEVKKLPFKEFKAIETDIEIKENE